MVEKIHKTHFQVTKEMPWKRLITISYVAGSGYECDVEGCEKEADYMGGGRTCCTEHWISLKEEE